MNTYIQICKPALVAACSLWLIGCASYNAPTPMTEASIPAAKLQEARVAVASLTAIAKSIEAVALANVNVCKHKANRMMFVALQNPPEKDNELRAAYVHAGLTEQPRLISTDVSTNGIDGKFITKVGNEEIGAGEVSQALASAYSLIREKKPLKMEFSDKTKSTIAVKEGCAGTVWVDIGSYEPKNYGTGVEVLSLDWFIHAKSEDARRFLAGRAFYYSSDEGMEKISSQFYVGAVANGLIRVVTLGLSEFVVDAKDTFTRMARFSVLKEADEFGLRAAVTSGADPVVILAFVRYMASQKKEATAMEELWFEDAREEALAKVVANLAAKNIAAITP